MIEKNTNYVIQPNGDWIETKSARTDFLFRHTDQSFFYSNSYCDHFEGKSLENLSKEHIQKFDNYKVVKQVRYTSPRESLYSLVKLPKDKRKVFFHHLGFYVDNCYYDLTLIEQGKIRHTDDFFNFYQRGQF